MPIHRRPRQRRRSRPRRGEHCEQTVAEPLDEATAASADIALGESVVARIPTVSRQLSPGGALR
jgi:hypothetical protein